MKLPITRNANLVEQELENELLVYNLITQKAYALNETSKIVYQACNGKTSFDDLRRTHRYTDDLIHLTLQELNAGGLPENYDSAGHFAGLNRREAVKRVGLATMATLPVIVSLIAPHAAHASSVACNTNPTCMGNGNCPSACPTCTGICGGNNNITCTNLGGSCVLSGGDCRGARCTNTGGRCTSSGQCTVSGTCSNSGTCRT